MVIKGCCGICNVNGYIFSFAVSRFKSNISKWLMVVVATI